MIVRRLISSFLQQNGILPKRFNFSTSSMQTAVSTVYELDEKQRKELEARKVQLYEMAQREYHQRDTTLIDKDINGILADFPICMHSLNIILKARILINDGDGIRSVLERISQAGLRPNAITYNLLISYYRNQGKMEDAMAIFRRMKETGIRANASIYTTLIAGFNSKGNFSIAEDLFQECQGSGHVHPDLHLYNTMITCYLSAGKPEEAQALSKQMIDAGIQPNHVTYKVFLYELLDNKDTEQARKLYDLHLKEKGVMRSHEYGHIAIKFFRLGDMQKGLEIYEESIRRFGRSSFIAHAFAIDCYSTSGKLDKIETIMGWCLEQKGLLEACCHALFRHYTKMLDQSGDPKYPKIIQLIYSQCVKEEILLSPKVENRIKEIISKIPKTEVLHVEQ